MTACSRPRAMSHLFTGTVRTKAMARLTRRLHQKRLSASPAARAPGTTSMKRCPKFHRSDGDRVGRKGETESTPERHSCANHRSQRQRVTEDERKHDREGNGGRIPERECGRQHHAENLANRTARKAMQRRLNRGAHES